MLYSMLISLTLLVMVMLTILSVILGSSYAGASVEGVVDNNLILNGSTSTLEFPTADYVFQLDAVQGALVWLIVLTLIGGALGIRVLGSGLSEQSVKIISYCIAYGAVWAILSILAFNLIVTIATFGSMIYIFLTVGYTIGVIRKLSGGNA